MKNVIIIGGGVSGLICANVLKKFNFAVSVYEPGDLGGEFLVGGLKYIHETEVVKDFLDELDVAWGDYVVKGGILLRGEIKQYPNFLNKMNFVDSSRIRADHYRKTRRMEPGSFGESAMNEPANAKSRRAVRCDFADLIKKLSLGIEIFRTPLVKISDNKAFFGNGSIVNYDFAVITIPLWILKRISSWEIPDCVAMKLNVVLVNCVKDRYVKWDYVYTPYTPADCIHRLSPYENYYSVECNGEINLLELYSDLNFLFNDGWCIERIHHNLKGHLLPLQGDITVPKNVELIGRFASWNPRMTVDVTLDKALELSKRWK